MAWGGGGGTLAVTPAVVGWVGGPCGRGRARLGGRGGSAGGSGGWCDEGWWAGGGEAELGPGKGSGLSSSLKNKQALNL